MVFLEFTARFRHDGKHYFVGQSVKDVLAGTHGGTTFGGYDFTSYRQVMEEEVRSLGLWYFEEGVAAVAAGTYKSFKLGLGV